MFATSSSESERTTITTTSSSSSVQRSSLCRHFDFSEILSATNNFDESLVVGRGGFGKVYEGNIYDGSTTVTAAIKRLDVMSSQGASEFWAKVEMLSKLRHCHLVSLIGYCNYEREMILVYEYMHNGTLEDHLHKLDTRLSWCRRLKMCIGAARGLEYLHTGTGIEFGIIHRDVKSSNILLDESWAAKVSDFGLSKLSSRNQTSTHVSTLVKGTFGYFDPYYFHTGHLTGKTDVYAFGVVLLEVLCRKRPTDRSLDQGLVTWAKDSIKAGRLKDLIDSNIKGEIFTKCLKQFVQIVKRCLNDHPNNRPTMAEVVLSLEHVLTLQEKTDHLLHDGGRTIFGRMTDRFFSTDSGQSSGVEFESLMPGKPRRGMSIGSLPPKKKDEHVQEASLLFKYKLENSVGSIKVFQAEELQNATMNFAEGMILQRDYFGSLYKGILPDSRVLAIKMWEKSSLEDYMNEIEIHGQIGHRNVVRLLGCCFDSEFPLLVYDFSSNGTLKEHIHDNRGRLSWDNRIRIAHESASALAYLHSDAMTTIIHGDVKSSNILLDENFIAKVSDLSASRSIPLGDEYVTTIIKGTVGYMDPEFYHTSQLTEKSDVYSFGVVLAEVLTGLKPIDLMRHQEDANLATYFLRSRRENRLHEVIDGQVLEEATDEQLKLASSLVCRCLKEEGKNRPSMKEVSIELGRLRKLIMHPNDTSQVNNDQTSSLMIDDEESDLNSYPSENNDQTTSLYNSSDAE